MKKIITLILVFSLAILAKNRILDVRSFDRIELAKSKKSKKKEIQNCWNGNRL